MGKLKAAVLERINEPLAIRNLSWPRLDFGQVRVQMLCAGICGAQLQEINGDKGDPRHLPHLLGHEGCGVVDGVGDGVTHVKPGDRVIIHWRKGDGCDVSGACYHPNARLSLDKFGVTHLPKVAGSTMIGSGPCTSFSDISIVSENRCTPIPKDFPNDLGALLGCALSTALATIEKETKWGQSILILGCGGVGLSLILAAKANHLWPIAAIDKNKYALATAMDMGAIGFDCIFDLDENCEFDPRFDVAIDTTGAPVMLSQAMDYCAKCIMIGQPKRFDNLVLPRPLQMFEGNGKTLKATQAGGFNPSVDIPRYVTMWQNGALNDYRKIIGHRIKLDQINEAIGWIRKGIVKGRVMIEF